MTQKLLVVIGITGKQGGSVARTYLKDPAWKVRGITRDPSSPSASELRAQGAELVKGNLDDVSSLEQAFRGAHAIFAVTDFWQFIRNPANFEAAAQAGKSVNEYSADLEIQQAKNIFEAAAKVLKEDGVLERFILSTLSSTKKATKGEIVWNWHFDGKAEFTEYLRDTYKDLAKITSYLQMGMYLENMFAGYIFVTPVKQSDGSFVVRHPPGAQHNYPIPFVHAQHDTGPLVKGLLNSPPGANILGYCRLLTWSDFFALWKRATGANIRSVEISIAELKAEVPEFLHEELLASYHYATKYGWAGGDKGVLGPFDVNVDKDELLDLEKWIAEQNWG